MLVVEDEAIIRLLLVDELADAGLAVIEASSADEALVVLQNGKEIGVVVSDVRMPGSIDGLGLAAWMRDHVPAVPIIIVSGFGLAPNWAAINPAITRVVSKPYAPCKIAGWVRELLG